MKANRVNLEGAYFFPSGRGSLVTGSDASALTSESALLRAHGRINDRGFNATALALCRIKRLDFACGFSVVAFIPSRVMESTLWGKFSLGKDKRRATDSFGASVVDEREGDLRIAA